MNAKEKGRGFVFPCLNYLNADSYSRNKMLKISVYMPR